MYRCRKGHTGPLQSDKYSGELVRTPLELINRIAQLVPPPRTRRHRYYGVLAPNSPLRAVVTAMAQDVHVAAPVSAVAVMVAGVLQQIHLIIRRLKEPALEPSGQHGSACAMAIIHMHVHAARVMKEGKQLHHMHDGASVTGEHQAIGPHTRPVGDAVVAEPVDTQLVAQMAQKFGAVKYGHTLVCLFP